VGYNSVDDNIGLPSFV